jgi:ATP-binding cassette subfamily E protein 1
MGKSTALAILAGKLKPNLGEFDGPPEWKSILVNFRGSELQTYFKRLLDDNLKVALKVQYVERFAAFEGLSEQDRVVDVLKKKDEKGACEDIARKLDLIHLMDREVRLLSGGELQRLAIAALCVQKADLYLVDEPSAYLDIRQRLRAAQVIREALDDTGYVVVVEHDLAVLDYLSDQVCCLWGDAGAYGVVTTPFGSSEGINHFLNGFIPTENMRIREEPLSFRVAENLDLGASDRLHVSEYPALTKVMQQGTSFQGFRLDVAAGTYADGEVLVLLGANGTGKTTFIKMLAGKLDPDNGVTLGKHSVSHKPQMFVPTFDGTVRELLLEKINASFLDPQFQSDVVRPMLIDRIAGLSVKALSGGELQRVALVLTLGKPTDVYLIDEPSAYLDVEQRVAAARVIRRFILQQKKTAFVVEHDFLMAAYLADRVIVFEGEPGMCCSASPPLPLDQGMNKFLANLGITVRRDMRTGRPKINKIGGATDREQKRAGTYFVQERK